MQRPNYLIYATILDSFQGYLSASEIYQDYYGHSDDPKISEEEFEKQQFQAVIDRINRVPFDSEAADQGTAFNEVVDCIIGQHTSTKMQIKSDPVLGLITVNYKERVFTFPIAVCREFAGYFKGASSQFYCEAPLQTKYGNVLLYGFIDELMPHSIHDIKTTNKYKNGKYRNNWQHVVYPFCLNHYGSPVTWFEYNVLQIGSDYSTFTEGYNYKPEIAVPKLTGHVESFIEFLQTNRDRIKDQKIFNLKS